jgi:hypothetical protein
MCIGLVSLIFCTPGFVDLLLLVLILVLVFIIAVVANQK